MFNQTSALGGLSSASTSLGGGGGGLGGAMFSQSSGLMGGTSKAGMFSNTGTGLNLGMGLGNQVRKYMFLNFIIYLFVYFLEYWHWSLDWTNGSAGRFRWSWRQSESSLF